MPQLNTQALWFQMVPASLDQLADMAMVALDAIEAYCGRIDASVSWPEATEEAAVMVLKAAAEHDIVHALDARPDSPLFAALLYEIEERHGMHDILADDPHALNDERTRRANWQQIKHLDDVRDTPAPRS